jgi:hypothetical protein
MRTLFYFMMSLTLNFTFQLHKNTYNLLSFQLENLRLKFQKFGLLIVSLYFFLLFNYRYKCSIFCDNLTKLYKIFIKQTFSVLRNNHFYCQNMLTDSSFSLISGKPIASTFLRIIVNYYFMYHARTFYFGFNIIGSTFCYFYFFIIN